MLCGYEYYLLQQSYWKILELRLAATFCEIDHMCSSYYYDAFSKTCKLLKNSKVFPVLRIFSNFNYPTQVVRPLC